MNVYGFEIKLNDEILCRAGFEKSNSVLTCIVDSVRRKQDSKEHLNFQVSGLNSDTRQHVKWFSKGLTQGDKISIEVISEDFDPPAEIKEQSSKEVDLEQKIKYYYKLKEELKEHLKE